MKYRQIVLESGTKFFLGKDAESNDELMKKFRGKENTILHTVAPGSPFCVIEEMEPTEKDVHAAGVLCARYSQDWRNNKGDVSVNVFTGKDVSKGKADKPGTWKVKKSKVIKIKKEDILKLIT
ncbi:MAG: NFACT RNA binding domain-containing protein [Nanoarchaeota archaeon]